MAAFDSTISNEDFFSALKDMGTPFKPESKALGGSEKVVKDVIKQEISSPLGDLSNFFAGIDKSLVRLVEFARKTFLLEKEEDERDKQTSAIIKEDSERDDVSRSIDAAGDDKKEDDGDGKSMFDSIKDAFKGFGDAFGQISVGEKLGAALLVGGLLLFNSVQEQLVAILTPIISVVMKIVDLLGPKGAFMLFLGTMLAIKFRGLIASAIGVAKSLGPAIWTGIGKAFTGINIASKFLLKGAQGALRALSGGMTKLFNGVGIAFRGIKVGMLAMRASLVPMLAPFLPIIAAAAAAVAVFVSLKSGFDVFKKSLEDGDSMFVAVLKGLQDAMLTLITLPYVLVQKLVGFIAGLFGFDSFKEKLEEFDIKSAIADAFQGMVGGMVKILKAVAAGSKAALKSIFKLDNPITAFGEAFDKVMDGGSADETSTQTADRKAGIETGDASTAEEIGKERNAKIKAKAKFMEREADFVYDDKDSYMARDIRNSIDGPEKYLDRRAKTADMLFEMSEADKLAYSKQYDNSGMPIVFNNTTPTTYNQKSETNVTGEIATEHSDRTSRAIEDAMSA